MFHVERVAEFTSNLYQNYEKCKGKEVKSLPDFLFWDAVVLTTGDVEQRRVFELQLEAKRSRGELPTDVPFHVFCDPPDTKTGNGGATINNLAELYVIYRTRMSSMRILLIHAGGKSQRLPSASVMGKIFTAIPVGEQISDMLDLNLAIFLPFLRKMQPGVFVTCSDVILPYYLESDDDWSFEKPGFTVLAHPSSIQIGAKHGVYVLKDAEAALLKNVGTYECLKVLQKPQEKHMRQNDAVIARNGEEFVYTDSVFFFDYKIVTEMLKFFADHGPIRCEIDGYGDFLQALGPLANSDYIHNMSNVSNVEPELLSMRLKVFKLLKNLPLNTIVLNESKFYHLGTMQEYITNFCEDTVLGKVMNFKKAAFNKILKDESTSGTSMNGSVLHSSLAPNSTIPEKSVIEFCNFSIPLSVGVNSIVSNCEYIPCTSGDAHASGDAELISVPANTFLHTIPIKENSQTLYIAIMCHTGDDLKKSTPKADVETLQFFGHDFSRVLKIWGRTADDVFPGSGACSLWKARLIPALATMTQALMTSLGLLHRLLGLTESVPQVPIPSDTVWLSMADMTSMKDVRVMLDYRSRLHDVIKASL